MAVALDATSEKEAIFATPQPATWTHSGGTPTGVLVGVALHTTSTDEFNGAVTYGGVALTEVASSEATDTTGEPGLVKWYWKAGGLSSGNQTVSVAHDGATGAKHAVCVTFTGTSLEIVDQGTLGGNQADPQITLGAGSQTGLAVAFLFSGLAAVTSLTPLSGYTEQQDYDSGSRVSVLLTQDTPATGNSTIGWTAASDDVAMTAVSIAEAAADPITTADFDIYLTHTTGPGQSTAQTDPDASLGDFVSSTQVTDASANNVFDDISGAENSALTVDYRVIAVVNAHSTDTMYDVTVWISGESANAPTIALAAEGSGASDADSASQQFEELTDENTAPSGETFTSPTDYDNGINLGDLTAGQTRGLIIRRTAVDSGAVSADIQLSFRYALADPSP